MIRCQIWFSIWYSFQRLCGLRFAVAMGASKVLKIKKPKGSKGLGREKNKKTQKTKKNQEGDHIKALPRNKQPALKRCPFSPKCLLHPKFAAMLLGCA